MLCVCVSLSLRWQLPFGYTWPRPLPASTASSVHVAALAITAPVEVLDKQIIDTVDFYSALKKAILTLAAHMDESGRRYPK